MKELILVTAALAIASPALAQSYDPEVGSGNIARNWSAPQSAYRGPEGAFARVVPGATRRHATDGFHRAPDTIYDNFGHVIGADPDPNVRLQLRKDFDSIGGF